MADEKTVVKGKEEKVNFFTKLVNFFKKLPSAIARPFKNMWHELRKVTWPSRQDVVKYSLIVLAFLVFMSVVIGVLDLGSTGLVKLVTPAATVEEQLPVETVVDDTAEGEQDAAEATTEEPAADAQAEPVVEQTQEETAAETAETPADQEEAAQP